MWQSFLFLIFIHEFQDLVYFATFQCFTLVTMKLTVLWDIQKCNVVKIYRRFRQNYGLHFICHTETSVNMRLRSVWPQKTLIFLVLFYCSGESVKRSIDPTQLGPLVAPLSSAAWRLPISNAPADRCSLHIWSPVKGGKQNFSSVVIWKTCKHEHWLTYWPKGSSWHRQKFQTVILVKWHADVYS